MKRTKHTKELRKVEVQKLMEEGLTQREISEKLSVSLKTVNNDCKEVRYEVEKKTKLSALDEDLTRVSNLGSMEEYQDLYHNWIFNDTDSLLQKIKNKILLEFERRLEIIPTSEIIKLTKDIIELEG